MGLFIELPLFIFLRNRFLAGEYESLLKSGEFQNTWGASTVRDVREVTVVLPRPFEAWRAYPLHGQVTGWWSR